MNIPPQPTLNLFEHPLVSSPVSERNYTVILSIKSITVAYISAFTSLNQFCAAFMAVKVVTALFF